LTLPGFVHDRCASIHALGVQSPALDPSALGGHAIEWRYPDIPLAHPLDGGRAAVLHRDLDATVAALDHGAAGDGAAWRRSVGLVADRWLDLAPQLLGPLLRLPRAPLTMTRFGVQALQPATWFTRRFAGEEAKALFGGCAAHAMLPLGRPLTTAFGLMLAASAHTGGWPAAAGGSQQVADVLCRRLVELGGEVRTGVRVTSMEQLPPHRTVLFDLNPAQVSSIAGEQLPARYRRSLERFRHGPGAYKVDFALSEPVPWTNPDCATAGTLHLVGRFDELVRAEAEVARGAMPLQPFVLAVQASLFDPSRAPAGAHTLWAYAHVPARFDGDALPAIEAQIERFAPGFRDVVLARHVSGPADLERYNANYVGGDIAGGAHTGTQLLFRPTRALRSYRTPNPSIVLCSASTPPGAGVHGMCGWHAAEVALRQLCSTGR
jgi:phytoene dehydrogenase-like protein